MAQFKPITEQEAKLAGLLKPGPGEFEILKAEDKVSQNGNDYLNLYVRLWDADGREGTTWDIIMYNGVMAYRLRHLMYACGMGGIYDAGEVDPAGLVGGRGSCTIAHKEDNRSGRMQNAVRDYLVPEATKKMERYQNSKAAAGEEAAGSVTRPIPVRAPRETANREDAISEKQEFADADIPF